MFPRLQEGPQPTASTGRTARKVQEVAHQLESRCGCQWIFRPSRLGPSAGVYHAEGQRWGHPETDRQVAARRRAGGGRAHAPGQGHAARRGGLADGIEYMPASGLGRLVCQGRPTPDEGPMFCDAFCGWHAGTGVKHTGCKSLDPNCPFGGLSAWTKIFISVTTLILTDMLRTELLL